MSLRRILVVEDERLIARDVVNQLRELGYEPLGPAFSAEEAIEMAGRMRPDLILMDVHLASEMDGIEAAQIIRSQFGSPLVYVSAFTEGGSLERAQRTNPAGYLTKPFLEYELRDVIAAVFQD